VATLAGGKSEHHTATCRVKNAGTAVEKSRRRKVSQKRHRRFFGNKAQARVKRRGKSSPLAEQFTRHEKPHVVQDKTEEGQPVRTPRSLSGLFLGYRRITADENSPGSRRNPGEINDHPREQSRRQNSAYRHRNMKGAFGNEGALRFLISGGALFAYSCRMSSTGSDLRQQPLLAPPAFRKAHPRIGMADSE
jgi:hypothetical protein